MRVFWGVKIGANDCVWRVRYERGSQKGYVSKIVLKIEKVARKVENFCSKKKHSYFADTDALTSSPEISLLAPIRSSSLARYRGVHRVLFGFRKPSSGERCMHRELISSADKTCSQQHQQPHKADCSTPIHKVEIDTCQSLITRTAHGNSGGGSS